MRPSVVQLRQFYSSRLGRRVKQRLRQLVLRHWPELSNEVIVGLGYAPPLLRVLERSGARTLALMPADQGAIYWPVHTDNRSILADEMLPPLQPGSIDRLVVVHAFEHVARPDELLKIYWEMLAPGGRMLLCVPNKFGFWSHLGRTPFRRGKRYSSGRVKDLLEDAQFTLRETSSALYAPPSAHGLNLGLWNTLEWLGSVLLPGLGGMMLIEAEKQIYANIAPPVVARTAPAWNGQTAIAGNPRNRI